MTAKSSVLPSRLVSTIACKQGPVRAVRFNVDGNYCVTCGGDKTVKLWNPHRALLLKTYTGHGYEVLDACSSCDNARMASSGYDKQVFEWDVATGKVVRKYRGHTMDEASDSVTALTVSDHELVSGSADGRTRRYDLRQGQMFVDFVGKSVTSVNFTKDGQCLLVSTLDSTVRLLDKDGGELLAEFSGHKNEEYKIDSCLLCSDTHVVSGSEDGKVFVWDLIEQKLVATLPHPSSRPVHSLSAHPTQSCLISACMDKVFVWKSESDDE